jgi:PEP-CTERM motif
MNRQFNSVIRISICIMALSAAILTTSIGQAASIWNVDCSTSNGVASGAAVVGSAGDVWNAFDTTDAGAAQSIVDSAGGNPIGFTFSAPGGNIFAFNPSGAPNPSALMDGFGSSVNGGGGTGFAQLAFTFSGLVPNTAYTVYGYGASTDTSDRGTFFFGPVNSVILGATSGASTNISSGAGVAWDDFVMTTNAAGSLTINTNFNSNTSAQGPVNGFQIVGPAPVPEPATICSLAIGGLVGLAMRKRLA